MDNKALVFRMAFKIRERRKLLGLSQTELADAAGVQFQQIQKYETGANRVSAPRLYLIARRLNVPIEYFYPVDCHASAYPEFKSRE